MRFNRCYTDAEGVGNMFKLGKLFGSSRFGGSLALMAAARTPATDLPPLQYDVAISGDELPPLGVPDRLVSLCPRLRTKDWLPDREREAWEDGFPSKRRFRLWDPNKPGTAGDACRWMAVMDHSFVDQEPSREAWFGANASEAYDVIRHPPALADLTLGHVVVPGAIVMEGVTPMVLVLDFTYQGELPSFGLRPHDTCWVAGVRYLFTQAVRKP